jgi:hypothetical protein
MVTAQGTIIVAKQIEKSKSLPGALMREKP